MKVHIRFIDEHVTDVYETDRNHWWFCITDEHVDRHDTIDLGDMFFIT